MHRDGRYRLNSKWHRLRTTMSRERRVFFVCLSRSNWAKEEFPFNPIIGIVIPPEPSSITRHHWLAGSTYFDDESSALQSVDALDWINLMIIVSFFDCTNWVQWPGLRLIQPHPPPHSAVFNFHCQALCSYWQFTFLHAPTPTQSSTLRSQISVLPEIVT